MTEMWIPRRLVGGLLDAIHGMVKVLAALVLQAVTSATYVRLGSPAPQHSPAHRLSLSFCRGAGGGR